VRCDIGVSVTANPKPCRAAAAAGIETIKDSRIRANFDLKSVKPAILNF
jgi:hypothetical protein